MAIALESIAGLDTYNELGTLDGYMTMSFEKIVMDVEIAERVKLICRGIDTSQEALCLDAIRDIAHDGSFLMHPSTIDHCREPWQPPVSCWDSFEEWKNGGARDTLRLAGDKCQQVLSKAPPGLVDSQIAKNLQAYMDRCIAAG